MRQSHAVERRSRTRLTNLGDMERQQSCVQDTIKLAVLKGPLLLKSKTYSLVCHCGSVHTRVYRIWKQEVSSGIGQTFGVV